MSRALIKEFDDAGAEPVPELVVSPHRKFVTRAGLARIEATVERLQGAAAQLATVHSRRA